MTKFWNPAAVLTATLALAAALPAQAQVGVSVEIAKPGVYGRVDIGRFPNPEVVLPRPVIIRPSLPVPRGAPPPPPPEPVYLWVPPGHRKHWSKHCARYNACGRPVYFVQDGWYDRHVGHGDRRGDERGDRRWDDRDGRGGDHGRGHGHGRGRHDGH